MVHTTMGRANTRNRIGWVQTWERRVEPNSGRTYFYNPNIRVSMWQRPTVWKGRGRREWGVGLRRVRPWGEGGEKLML